MEAAVFPGAGSLSAFSLSLLPTPIPSVPSSQVQDPDTKTVGAGTGDGVEANERRANLGSNLSVSQPQTYLLLLSKH